jgi:hypothetical protein
MFRFSNQKGLTINGKARLLLLEGFDQQYPMRAQLLGKMRNCGREKTKGQIKPNLAFSFLSSEVQQKF